MKSIFIVIGAVAVLGLLLAYVVGPGKSAGSDPSGGARGTSTPARGLPPIDLARPAVTETAAFAFG